MGYLSYKFFGLATVTCRSLDWIASNGCHRVIFVGSFLSFPSRPVMLSKLCALSDIYKERHSCLLYVSSWKKKAKQIYQIGKLEKKKKKKKKKKNKNGKVEKKKKKKKKKKS